MVEPLHILTLLSVPRIGRRTVRKYLPALESLSSQASVAELRDSLSAFNTAGALPDVSIIQLREAQALAEKRLEQARKLNLSLLTPSDSRFPQSLEAIPDPPVLLYASGDAGALTKQSIGCVAVIGTREPSDFGIRSARRLGERLAAEDVMVVNGLAVGIDSAALQGALAAAKGGCVAVVANGLDTTYPKSNTVLRREIEGRGGCLISESHPGEEIARRYFVDRDRLQSGLAQAVVVVEAGEKSGTMHTVEFALQQHRPVWAFVHPSQHASHPMAAGNRFLLDSRRALPLANTDHLSGLIREARRRSRNA